MCLHDFAHMQLSVGDLQSIGSEKTVISKRIFHGCLENLLYNDLNLIELVKRKDQQVTVMVSQLSYDFIHTTP